MVSMYRLKAGHSPPPLREDAYLRRSCGRTKLCAAVIGVSSRVFFVALLFFVVGVACSFILPLIGIAAGVVVVVDVAVLAAAIGAAMAVPVLFFVADATALIAGVAFFFGMAVLTDLCFARAQTL